ncbi:MAG: nuclear transport factor 2 family protein [Ginsengibacter sp.]
MQKNFIILLIGLSPVLSFAQENSPKQTEVMIRMLALRNALINKDSVALDDVLAGDVSYGHTSGLIQTKSQLIRSVISKEQDYQNIIPSDMQIRIYDNTGVVTMKTTVIMNYQGKPLNMDMYITLVWVKKNKWQLVARQSVKQ